MIVPVSGARILIQAPSSFLLVGVVQDPFTLFIETSTDEYCQYLKTGDLVMISAPEGGAIQQASILLELVLLWHTPLMVLPPGHPGSSRLNMVVSAGDRISMNCSIERGTHPEQTTICSSEELAGMELVATDDGVEVSELPSVATIYLITPDGSQVPFS